MHKILLVDDTRHFLDLEKSFLKRAECKVVTATTGVDAVRLARQERPDLILLDIEMPEMNGIQVCRILKSDPVTKGIGIVILSSMKMEDEARRAGADHFLKKPIDEPTFLAEVRRYVPIRERREARVSIEAPATFRIEPHVLSGRVLNVSRSGLFVATPTPLEVGSRTIVSFQLPTGLAVAAVLVVRVVTEPDLGFGGSFLQDPPDIAIERFLSDVPPT